MNRVLKNTLTSNYSIKSWPFLLFIKENIAAKQRNETSKSQYERCYLKPLQRHTRSGQDGRISTHLLHSKHMAMTNKI